MVACETSSSRAQRSEVVKGMPSSAACTIRSRTGWSSSSEVCIGSTLAHLIPLSIVTIIVPPMGHLADVEGRRLWMDQAGAGRPAVVFAPGAGSVALDFLLVHQRVAEMTTSVLYDRAGTGWSEDVELPRSAEEVIDELRAVLRASEVPAPYLLVG